MAAGEGEVESRWRAAAPADGLGLHQATNRRRLGVPMSGRPEARPEARDAPLCLCTEHKLATVRSLDKCSLGACPFIYGAAWSLAIARHPRHALRQWPPQLSWVKAWPCQSAEGGLRAAAGCAATDARRRRGRRRWRAGGMSWRPAARGINIFCSRSCGSSRHRTCTLSCPSQPAAAACDQHGLHAALPGARASARPRSPRSGPVCA